ncbi:MULTISPECIES: hypothetical protein [Pseudomonas]|uniref:hypothetical protein n=1 Tax=Pseudomonas TaxID=286 RepID=UPI000499BC2E|nr:MULTISPECIES: hypothetical protein [Pseudomonas]AHZ78327.1 hypothetical protein DW66_3822 [Pseudomonas putida]QUN65915.1 hypothetical protein KDB76_18730 [Pseudomonas sp. JS425]
MSKETVDLLARLERRNAGGLALLPDDLQVALQNTTDDFRQILGAALLELHGGAESSEYVRGINYGFAMGILTAGGVLGLISHKQHEALMTALAQVQPE